MGSTLNKVVCSKCQKEKAMTSNLRKMRITKFGTIEVFEKTFICLDCRRKIKGETKVQSKNNPDTPTAEQREYLQEVIKAVAEDIKKDIPVAEELF